MRYFPLVLAGFALTVSIDASAACDQTGNTISCTGTTESGFISEAAGLSLTVVDDATVSDPQRAVHLGPNATLDNRGLLIVDGFVNDITIVIVRDGSTIVNDGTIIGTTAELPFITSFGVGIRAGSGTITNNDLIDMTARGDASIVYGINMIAETGEALITNNGMIKVRAEGHATGVYTNGTVANNGTIDARVSESYLDARGVAASEVDNQGIINAISFYGARGIEAEIVNNRGEINVRGQDKYANAFGVWLLDGGEMVNSGEINVVLDQFAGAKLGEPDADGAGVSVIVEEGLSARITNTETGKVVSDADGINITSSDTLLNEGRIEAGRDGIGTTNFAIFNNTNDALVTNKGTIVAGRDGIHVDGAKNVLVNEGSIDAGRAGINSTNGNFDFEEGPMDISNLGTIKAGHVGILTGNDATITNEGDIAAENGIITGDNVALKNDGAIVADLAGIAVGKNGDVRNIGEIDAKVAGITADELTFVLNEGDIVVGAGGVGIRVGEVNGVRNDGTITSGGDGIGIGRGTSVNNAGTITAEGSAIKVESGVPSLIVNRGLLQGTNALYASDGNDRITNYGTMIGDVLLGDGADEFGLGQGAFIKGDVDGGADGGGTDFITSTGIASVQGKIIEIERLVVLDGELSMELATGSEIVETVVDVGALKLNGELTGNVIVKENGTLTGVMTIIGNLENAGIVGAGNSPGMLTIDGNYMQAESGDLFVEIGSTSADKLLVSGMATLDGSLTTGLQAADLASLEGKSYMVLTAGTIAGDFDKSGTVQQGFWTLNIEKTDNAVIVTVADVAVPIGAASPMADGLAGMLGKAADGAPADSGVVITNPGLPPDPGVITGLDNQQQAASLNYDSLGDWESAAASYTGGFDGLGVGTPATSMPRTGSGTFEGTTKGELTETASGAPEAFVVEGNVMLTANFASGLVNADFTEMEKINADGVASAWIDFRARMSIADGTSEFAGTAGTDDGVWNGEAKGGFFGDEGGMPGHAAGLWSMSSPLGRALGGFTAKRQ